MSFLKKLNATNGSDDIAMAERLRAVSGRGKLETSIYEGWQPEMTSYVKPSKTKFGRG
jgi:hypothetical protein